MIYLNPGETFEGFSGAHVTEMQSNGSCDICERPLPDGAVVVGKCMRLRKGQMLGSRFSPTCPSCALCIYFQGQAFLHSQTPSTEPLN